MEKFEESLLTARDEGEKIAAEFVGFYLADFLKIESKMENLIIFYLSEDTSGKNVPMKSYKRNSRTRTVLEHNLFGSESCSTQLKIIMLKSFMQIYNAEFFQKYGVKFFKTIAFLQEFRNLIAHNPTGFEDGNIIVSKPKSEFKDFTAGDVSAKQKPQSTAKYVYMPYFKELAIGEKEKEEIYFQLRAIDQALLYYNTCYIPMLEEMEMGPLKMFLHNLMDYPNIYKGGVYNFIKS